MRFLLELRNIIGLFFALCDFFPLCIFTLRKHKHGTFDVCRLAIQRLEIAKNDLQHRIAKEVCLFSSLFYAISHNADVWSLMELVLFSF